MLNDIISHMANKRQLINLRFPVLIILSLICGILLGYLFIRIQIDLFYVIATVPAVAIILILCRFNSKYRLMIFCLTCIFMLILGATLSYIQIKTFDSKQLVNGDTYTVCATVSDKGKTDSGEYIIVDGVFVNGMRVGGKIKVYLSASYGEKCDVGYEVKFTSKITNNDIFPYGKLNYNAEKNIKYTCFVQSGLTSKYKFSLFGSMNSVLRNALFENLDSDTASVAFAMLTGNTDFVDSQTVSAFRYGGIAHIFAVSGLHIGIIYGILRVLFKKRRLNRYIKLALCLVPLFLYTGICGFTVSSVRALIMCAVATIAQTFFVKYDALNSLSISAVIILILNPLTLFSVGFQLSFTAVASIIFLSKNIVRPFKKLPRKVTDTVGVSLSAQAGTMPVMLSHFGYLSGAGIIMNIFLVPLLSLFFILQFFGVLISLILPFTAGYILPYSTLPLKIILSFLINAGFEKALLSGFGAGAFIPFYCLILFTLSDKINLKIFQRITALVCSFIFLSIYIPLKTYFPFSGHKIIVTATYNGGAVLIKSNGGNILILTENVSDGNIRTFLNEYYSYNLDAVILLGGENCVGALNKFDIDCDIYIYGKYLNIQPFENIKINYEKNFSLNGAEFTYADGYSVSINCEGTEIGICGGKYSPFDSCDLIIGDCLNDPGSGMSISFNDRSFDNCVYDHGNFELLLKNGNIK